LRESTLSIRSIQEIYGWVAPTFARECVGSFVDSACGPYSLVNPAGWQPTGDNGSGGLLAGALAPGANGKFQAVRDAAKNLMKHVKADPDPIPGKWEPPTDIEEFLSEESRAIKSALDGIADILDGGITIMLMIDPNLIGCAGHGGMSCHTPARETSF